MRTERTRSSGWSVRRIASSLRGWCPQVPLIDRTIRDPNVVYKVEQSSSGGVDPVYRVISATCPTGNSALQVEKEHPSQATLPLVDENRTDSKPVLVSPANSVQSPGVVPLIDRTIRVPKVVYQDEESSRGGVDPVYQVIAGNRIVSENSAQVLKELPGPYLVTVYGN